MPGNMRSVFSCFSGPEPEKNIFNLVVMKAIQVQISQSGSTAGKSNKWNLLSRKWYWANCSESRAFIPRHWSRRHSEFNLKYCYEIRSDSSTYINWNWRKTKFWQRLQYINPTWALSTLASLIFKDPLAHRVIIIDLFKYRGEIIFSGLDLWVRLVRIPRNLILLKLRYSNQLFDLSDVLGILYLEERVLKWK